MSRANWKAVIGAALLGCMVLGVQAQQLGELWETRLSVRSSVHGDLGTTSQQACQEAPSLDPASIVPAMPEDCPELRPRREGDRFVWSGACRQGEAEGEVRLVSEDRLEGHMTIDGAEGRFEMRFEGDRLGVCTLEAQ